MSKLYWVKTVPSSHRAFTSVSWGPGVHQSLSACFLKEWLTLVFYGWPVKCVHRGQRGYILVLFWNNFRQFRGRDGNEGSQQNLIISSYTLPWFFQIEVYQNIYLYKYIYIYVCVWESMCIYTTDLSLSMFNPRLLPCLGVPDYGLLTSGAILGWWMVWAQSLGIQGYSPPHLPPSFFHSLLTAFLPQILLSTHFVPGTGHWYWRRSRTGMVPAFSESTS